MSKGDLRKLNGMQQQPTFYNPIFHVGEIMRAYPVNKNIHSMQLFAVLKVVTPLWSVGFYTTKGLPISRLRKIRKDV